MKVMKYITALMIAALYTSTAIGAPHVEAVSGSSSQAAAGSQSIGQVANDTAFSYSSTVTNNANNKDLAPTLFAPGLVGGTNPCVVSMSGGITTGGFGFSAGNAYVDKECEVRESLRLMAAISNAQESANQTLLREIACQSAVYWDAMERTSTSLDDPRYHCLNPRPIGPTYAKVREEGSDVYVVKRNHQHVEIDDCDDYNDYCF